MEDWLAAPEAAPPKVESRPGEKVSDHCESDLSDQSVRSDKSDDNDDSW